MTRLRTTFEVTAIGVVVSPLRHLADAPPQGDEGAPPAWLVLDTAMTEAIDGLHVGAEIVVVTWLHQASRSVLRNHPRGDPTRNEQGVFTTRSPDRPNPIGLHTATVLAVDRHRIRVDHLEAIHGTPVLDIKPAMPHVGAR